jgi:hypothetical protein
LVHWGAECRLKEEVLPIVTIAKYLDVPLAFVVQIQQELQKNPNLN